jgi:HK97 family phage prohead protease
MATYRGEEIDLAPTQGMKDEAQRGLDWREEYGRGGTAVGVAKARAILTEDELSPGKVIDMYAYFARHEVDKNGEGFEPGEDGYPSAGRIAWALWGGDPGQAWSTRKREEMMRIDEALDEARSAAPAGREIKAVACSYKALEADRTFEGYGSVFGVIDSYGDVVMPGAFTQTIRKAEALGRMPAMLWQHDPSQVIGVWRSMREDAHGLHVVGELADTQLGREAYALLKMGALSGLSIGYSLSGEHYDRERDVRELTGIDLWETSLVTFPANTDARVAAVKDARSGGYRGLERILREAGFSRSEAKAVATAGMRALREADDRDLTAEEAAALCRRFIP